MRRCFAHSASLGPAVRHRLTRRLASCPLRFCRGAQAQSQRFSAVVGLSEALRATLRGGSRKRSGLPRGSFQALRPPRAQTPSRPGLGRAGMGSSMLERVWGPALG